MSFFTKALKPSVAKTEAITLKALEQKALKALESQVEVNPLSVIQQLESIKQSQKTAKAKARMESNKAQREAGTLVKVGSVSFVVKGEERVVPIEERKNPDGSTTQWAITRDGLFPKRLSTLEKQCAFHGTETKIEWNSEVPQ